MPGSRVSLVTSFLSIKTDCSDLMLRLLNYRPSDALRDLMCAFSDGVSSETECQERAAWTLQSPITAAWLDSPRSKLLIVNSEEDDHDSQSAVSFFASMLVRALDAAKPAIVLHWFCSQRRNDSVYSMLKSLLCQILDNFNDLEAPEDLSNDTHISIGRMASVFIRCLEVQMRSTSVFILIDSLSYYESSDRVRDTCWLLDRIAAVASSQPHSSGHTLKVLVTSPTRFSRLGQTLDRRSTMLLSVPDIISGNSADLDDRRLIQAARIRLLSRREEYG